MVSTKSLESADIAVIVVYFGITFAVAIYTMLKPKASVNDFFLAGRSMSWWTVGMSLFASNLGCTAYLGLSSSGAGSGIAVIMYDWTNGLHMFLLGWVFVPIYIASGIYTMPEYLYWRFGGARIRIYLSVIYLATYLFTVAVSDLYSAALFLQQTLGWNIWGCACFMLGLVLVFTVLGGMETVILTDAFAVVVMVVGGLCLSIVGFNKIGGYDNLQYVYMRSVPNVTIANTTCGMPREDAFHIFRHIWKADFPWLGTVLRATIASVWYWETNQYLVQRILSAKNITHAKGGCATSGLLKILPMFILIFPGMISRALFPDEVACVDPEICKEVCGNPGGCSNIALPKLIMEILPQGVRGLLISAVIAAGISSLTSIFNSSSALFTMDIWSKVRPRASPRELLFVGRIFMIFMVGASLLLFPFVAMSSTSSIFEYAINISGILAAPTCATFLLAVFWRRCNEVGCFWGMVVAQAWGMVKFVMDAVYPRPPCGEPDTRPGFVSDWHIYYHTFSQIVLAFIIIVVVSLCTDPPGKERLAGLTFWTRFEKPHRDKVIEQKIKEAKKLKETEEKNDGKELTDQDNAETGPLPLKERITVALCGSSTEAGDIETSRQIVSEHSARLASLQESKNKKIIVNTFMILYGIVAAFLFGFFH